MSGERLCKLCPASIADKPPQTRYCAECRRVRNCEIARAYAERHPEAVAATFKKWAAANAEHLDEYRRKRSTKKTPEQKARDRELARARNDRYLAKHPEVRRAYYVKNAERVKARSRAYYENNRLAALIKMARRYDENPAATLARVKAWREANPEQYREQCRRQQARRRSAGGAGVTPEDWSEILAAHDNRCAYCGRGGDLTRDHVTPISRGGPDDPSNVVPACVSCNSSKSNKTKEEWLKRKHDRHLASATKGVVETD